MTSKERVKKLFEGVLPYRPPYFDLIRNDKVLTYLAGEDFKDDNKLSVVCRAMSKALDATRPAIAIPNEPEREEILSDGRKRVIKRWTIWTEQMRYSSSAEFAKCKTRLLDNINWEWTEEDQEALRRMVDNHKSLQKRLGDVFLFWKFPGSTGLYDLCNEVGVEQISYYLYDCPDIIEKILDYSTTKTIQRIENLPDDACPDGLFIAEDIAYKGSTLFSPKYLRESFFPRLKKIISACHKKGFKVLFHSDGNLMDVLDDLVDAGIDGLNPIEIEAGMKVKEIHKRHKHLVLAGGIDVSQLLPYGNPDIIEHEVCKALEEAEGMIMPGSSTELGNEVPLENFLAMHRAIINYKY